jgi:hypothetical protein
MFSGIVFRIASRADPVANIFTHPLVWKGRLHAQIMLRRILFSFLVVTTFLCAFAPRQSDQQVFDQINSIVRSLSGITGLSEKHSVPYGRISKRQLRQFLTKRIKKTLKPEEIYADELSLKMFGLVPANFDLRKSTLDLLTEQAAAFYDYEKKKLFLLEGSSLNSETTTLAHELSHALADQHFNLETFMQDAPSNDDENLAHTAVVEGQASWLMIAYDLKEAGRPPVPTAEMLRGVGNSSEASMAGYPVLKDSPLYIQQSLLFPYTEGILFFNAVYEKKGKEAFAAVFRDPPTDSAEIIHPDRYLAHEKAAKPDLPKLFLNGRAKDLTEGSVGEFDHEMMLRQYVGAPQSKLLAPHLRGGRFKIAETGERRKPLLEYISEWDSEEHAADFFRCYQKIINAKWKHCDVSTANETTFAGEGDNGYFLVRLSGATVMSVEGLSNFTNWEHLTAPARRLSAKVHCGLELQP